MRHSSLASGALAASGAPSTIDKREGPYDFTWFLERCADFGKEVPPWHTSGALPSEFRSDPPPPPLQLLVPEAVSFEPPDGKGRSAPRAVFFTDRAGFLRGARRAARQGGHICQALLRLMRHRQLAVTLSHSSGIPFEQHALVNGAKAWSDRTFVYTGIPKELDGATFFAGPHSSVPTGELLLSAPVHGTAYVWSEDKAESDGGLPNIGWECLSSTMSFGQGRTMKIYRKMLTAGSYLVIPVHFMWVGGIAFQPEERPELDQLARSESPSGSGCSPGGHSRAPYESGATESNSLKRRMRNPPKKSGTFIEQKGLGCGGSGGWKLTFYNGATKQLSNDEVSTHFGLTADGRTMPWPTGAKCLQLCFWVDQQRHPGKVTPFVYHYDALRAKATAEHEGIAQNIMNHFERYSFLTSVADHNLVSSAPIQTSQHLSYHCRLELLSGDFEFVRDNRGQLWLADARNLFFIPAARSSGANGGAASAAASDSKDPLSQKLPRYLSEEALHNLKVSEDTGTKCQRMQELMAQHYRRVKEVSGMDELLKKTDEVVEVSIPMLEGTDRRAFARTFGIKKEKTGEVGVNVGLAMVSQRRQPTAPKQQGFIGRGRLVKDIPRPLSSQASNARRRLSRPLQQPPSRPLSSTMGSTTPRSPAGGARTPRGSAARSKSTSSASQYVSPRARARTLQPCSGRDLDDDRGGSSEEITPTIEIVLPESAQKLLHFSGPGLRPDGATMDIVGPMSAREPGAGLLERRRAGQPQARAVEVPKGAVAALGSYSAASRPS